MSHTPIISTKSEKERVWYEDRNRDLAESTLYALLEHRRQHTQARGKLWLVAYHRVAQKLFGAIIGHPMFQILRIISIVMSTVTAGVMVAFHYSNYCLTLSPCYQTYMTGPSAHPPHITGVTVSATQDVLFRLAIIELILVLLREGARPWRLLSRPLVVLDVATVLASAYAPQVSAYS